MNLDKIFDPNTKHYKILFGITCIVATVIAGFFISRAGSLNPTSAPGDTMVTLDDIYCKLTGCTPGTYGIDSPGSPAATMHTLQEIYDATPDFRNDPGTATTDQVWAGATFYTNSATKQTGTLTLTGNATPAQVKSGRYFYSNSLTRQQGTGQYVMTCASSGPAPDSCQAHCIALGLTCYNQGHSGSCPTGSFYGNCDPNYLSSLYKFCLCGS